MLNRLLRLHKTDKNGLLPLENFTTEVFVGLLNMYEEIKIDFLYNQLKLPPENYSIKSQRKYSCKNDSDCVIDIVIAGSKSICFIENKVEAKEGYKQLKRYCSVLEDIKRTGKETYLVYCTKYFDDKDIKEHHFQHIRWYNVALFLRKYNHNPFVFQFLTFLKSKDMAQDFTFNAQDIQSLQKFQNVIKKVSAYLEKVKNPFIETFIMKQTLNVNQLSQIKNHNRLIFYFKNILAKGGWSEIKYGFLFDKPEIYVGIWVDKKNSDYAKFREIISKYKGEFHADEISEGAFIELKKDISIFVNDEEAEQKITEWFLSAFEEFRKIIVDTRNLLNWNLKTKTMQSSTN